MTDLRISLARAWLMEHSHFLTSAHPVRRNRGHTMNDDDTDEKAEHGTYAGAQKHQRAGERACEPCAKARSEYMRQYRKTHTRYVEAGRQQNRAYKRAVQVLVEKHRDEFDQFYTKAKWGEL